MVSAEALPMQNNRPESKTEQIYRYRTLLIDKVVSNDTAAIRTLYLTLVNDYESEYYVALYPFEKRVINLILKDYTALTNEYISTNDESIGKFKSKIEPKEDGLGKILYNKLVDNKQKLLDEVGSNNSLASDSKAFIKMIIENYTATMQDNAYRMKTNADASVFINKFPESKLTSYVRNYMRYEYKPKGFLFGIEFYAGPTIISSETRNYIGSGGGFGFGFIWGYNNWQLNTRAFISFSDTHKDLYYKGIRWSAESDAETVFPELSLGYTFKPSKKISLTPLMGLGWMSASPIENDIKKNPDLEDVEISSKASPLYGVDLGWNLSETYSYNSTKKKYSYGFSSVHIRYVYQDNRFPMEYREMTGQTHILSICFKMGITGAKRIF
ncbi:hypothetical protein [Parabacteroides sp. FAFU027]|uniref:hypothetical protein n=1 Tax=Parabacteroides sp. FAFU027 TaxID=2922715 RepID=UPI001FAF40FA|nr:hypothetical protein [Parabacteroides sp. FAFU027]